MAGTTTFHGNVQPMYTEQNPSWLEKEFIFHDEEDQHQHTPTKRIEDGNSKKIALSNNIVFDVSENEHHKQPSSSVSLASVRLNSIPFVKYAWESFNQSDLPLSVF
jgi:hypothetical protein